MKVRTITLKHFKKFRDRTIDLVDSTTGSARDLVVLVGPNGSGKTTVLQAIAACLGTATRRIEEPSELDWPGFDLPLAGQAWGELPEVQLDVEFGQDEILATHELYQELVRSGRHLLQEPGSNPRVNLQMQGNQVQTPVAAEIFQFRGREYTKQLIRQLGFDMFERVGFVYWYHEQRTTSSLTPLDPAGTRTRFDLALLRRRLGEWQAFHDRVGRRGYRLKRTERDLYNQVQDAYKHVFPDRRLVGMVPRSQVGEIWNDPYFYLHDGKHQYELEEMSGGERAVFPILFDFVNWNIHRSVILIDEIELHLHPPMQQMMLRALSVLGRENQVILTSHSDAISAVVPAEAIIRLDE